MILRIDDVLASKGGSGGDSQGMAGGMPPMGYGGMG